MAAPTLVTIYGVSAAPGGPTQVLPRATRHGSGVLPITPRQGAQANFAGAVAATTAEATEEKIHAPQSAHWDSQHQGARPGLNMRDVGPSRLRSAKRLRARLDTAVILAEAMRMTGQSNPDIAAALDCAREDVVAMRGAEKPFEVGHLRLLPEVTAAVILARLVARLGAAARALFADEEQRVRGAA